MSRRPTYNPTWFERATMPDLITRGIGVGSGAPTSVPDTDLPDSAFGIVPVDPWFTDPAMRPTVTQRMLNFVVTANTPAAPISNGRLDAIGFIMNVYSTAAASAWWGPNGVLTTTGIEIQPGIPQALVLDQDREMWELQRGIEHIGALMATQMGAPMMGPYRAPRVIFDLSQFYLASVAAQSVAIVAFLPPELQ